MKSYTVIIEAAANNYSAYVPDLPGCTATGETVEETREQMKQAIELHIVGMKDDGLAIPEPRTMADRVEVSA